MLKPLNTVRNLKDPLKMFVSNWSLAFTAGTDLANAYAKLNTNSDNELVLRCQTFGLPTITGDKTVVNWGGFERRYAGKQTRAGDWSVTFTEVWDNRITDFFRIWYNAYHHYIDGKIGLLSDYAAQATVTLLDPDVYDTNDPDFVEVKYNIILHDVFPTSMSFPNITASSSDPVTLTATFNFNYFTIGPEEEAALKSNG